MLYRFHVFHNAAAIATHKDFVCRQKITDEDEALEYSRFPVTLTRYLKVPSSRAATLPAAGRKGVLVLIETELPFFEVGRALAKVLVDRNTVVPGLFLDFAVESSDS